MKIPYIILVGIAVAFIWFLNGKFYTEELTLYGFAETKETEINLNFPVVIEELKVLSGQSVKAGEVLLTAKRTENEMIFEDQKLKINEINAKKKTWKSEQEGKRKELKSNYLEKIESLDLELNTVRIEIEQQKELYKGLDQIVGNQELPATHPDVLKIEKLEEEKKATESRYQIDIANLESIIAKGALEDDENIKRLQAEYQYLQDNKDIEVKITAPTDGLIGNVHCKEGENISDYRVLISFYEPNPTHVKAYVHEDYLVEVEVGDEFQISSIKDASQTYTGKVVALGSRIVEIPARMRKVPEYKTYGREVVIKLPAESRFLQNEKLTLVSTSY